MQESPLNPRPEDEALYRPEPDAIVLRQPCSEFEDADPEPQQIQIAVEISDSCLRFDLAAKSRAYARAAIPEYWVVDANGRRVIVHREPSSEQYRSVKSYAVGEEIAPLSRPAARIEIAAFFR